jgi:hypothetical protein
VGKWAGRLLDRRADTWWVGCRQEETPLTGADHDHPRAPAPGLAVHGNHVSLAPDEPLRDFVCALEQQAQRRCVVVRPADVSHVVVELAAVVTVHGQVQDHEPVAMVMAEHGCHVVYPVPPSDVEPARGQAHCDNVRRTTRVGGKRIRGRNARFVTVAALTCK